MAHHIICNPKGVGYTIKNVDAAYIAQSHASGSEQFVLYDPERHADWKPGDVHDGKGGFSTPELSPEKREQALAVLDAITVGLFEAIQELDERKAKFASMKKLAVSLKAPEPEAGDLIELTNSLQDKLRKHVGSLDSMRNAVAKAKTHHELPDLIRAEVRGWPDGHDRKIHARAAAEAKSSGPQ